MHKHGTCIMHKEKAVEEVGSYVEMQQAHVQHTTLTLKLKDHRCTIIQYL